MIKFAVISFPGTNCESESLRAFRRNGMEAETVLWNDTKMLEGKRLDEFDGYCIAGGFSYEDRGRSGVVAAQDPITQLLKEEADRGKVILGICNGAQILVETGLIPGFDNKALGVALAWNEMKEGGKIVNTGFYNAWAYLKNSAPKGRSAFNDFDELLHIPFAHGEGRFVVEDSLLAQLEKNDQILFKYADSEGRVDSHYPITPNGAVASIAALCNPAGNVMAMMPHPERDPMGNGNGIFTSIRRWIESKKSVSTPSLGEGPVKKDLRPMLVFDLEIFVQLIITDNTERTIEEALGRQGVHAGLRRFEYFGIRLRQGIDPREAAVEFLKTGELANFNKHRVYVRMEGQIFMFHPEEGLIPKELNLNPFVVALDQKDFLGESKKAALRLHAGDSVEEVRYGVLWHFDTDRATMERIIDSKMLYNPYAMYLMQSL